MSTIVEISIPADEFALGRALDAHSQLQIELERIIPTGTAVFPYFWARGDSIQRFETAVRDDPAIQDLTKLDTFSDRTLFRSVWNDEMTGLVQGIKEANATVMEANNLTDDWSFHLRFPAQEQMSTFQSFCHREEIPVEVERVYSFQEVPTRQLTNLTGAQQETLVTAYEEGYFERPREITLEELADELDISPQAVGGRLRRGYSNLIVESFRSLTDRYITAILRTLFKRVSWETCVLNYFAPQQYAVNSSTEPHLSLSPAAVVRPGTFQLFGNPRDGGCSARLLDVLQSVGLSALTDQRLTNRATPLRHRSAPTHPRLNDLIPMDTRTTQREHASHHPEPMTVGCPSACRGVIA